MKNKNKYNKKLRYGKKWLSDKKEKKNQRNSDESNSRILIG